MTDLTFRIGTDLLWNSDAPEDYAELNSRLSPDVVYTKEELRESIFDRREYEDEQGKTQYLEEEWDKLSRNIHDVEHHDTSPPTVDLNGLCLITKTETTTGEPGFKLTEDGERLRSEYLEGGNWRQIIAELVSKYFIRARVVLYYIGQQGYRLKWKKSLFSGDVALVDRGLEYTFYSTDLDARNGAYTCHGLSEQFEADDFDTRLFDKLYRIEYGILDSSVDVDDSVGQRVLELLDELREQLAQGRSEPTDDAIDRAREILTTVDESILPSPRSRFVHATNLLWAANPIGVTGPFNLSRAGIDPSEVNGNEIQVAGKSGSEPTGGHVMVVTRRALRLLQDTGLLTELDSGIQVTDRSTAESFLSDEVVEDIFSAEFDVSATDDDDVYETLQEACLQLSEGSGLLVTWPDVQEVAVNQLDMTESAFRAEVDRLRKNGRVDFIGETKKNMWNDDGPPGFENWLMVRVEFLDG